MLLRLFYLSVLLIGLTSCEKKKEANTEETEEVEMTFKKDGELELINDGKVIQKLDIEIADNETTRAQGLMYRSSMQENQAMLFIMDSEEIQSFYMKNTRIPLDIIYFSADSVVVDIKKDTKPFDTTGLPSAKPAKFVLEVNAGLSDKWGIEVGKTKFKRL